MNGLYDEIVETYKSTGSVKDTAEIVGVSKVKTQKVLITERLWSSKSSERICQLYKAGIPASEIAVRLGTSVKNVHAYIPYSKGEYGAVQTGDSVRCRRYRQRLAVIRRLKIEGTDEAFWSVVVAYQSYPFYTIHGIRFSYLLREENILFKSGKEEKSFTRSFVAAQYHKALVKDDSMSELKTESVSSVETWLNVMFQRWNIIGKPGADK